MSNDKLIPFRQKEASARVEIFEDEEELRLLFEFPITDCAICITFWKGNGKDDIASVSMWTHGRERRLTDNGSLATFRRWMLLATGGKPWVRW